ncbi:ABC transporter permease [Kordiimonas sp.]|uniref:ABC transporter permease n=1 Tax=Kordiimonas sp. TaxID=1970157 RepID=UPI003B525A1B
MFKNYMMTAMRNLLRYKQYTLINILGLAVGLAACLLILLYVNFELSYDRWIPENDRVMRVEALAYDRDGNFSDNVESLQPVAAPIFAEQVESIEQFSRLLDDSVALAVDGNAFEQEITIADPGVFDLMGITLLEGDAATALNSPDAIVLSLSDSRRVFGEQSPLGRVVKINGEHTLKVTGVMPDWPKASDIEVHAFIPGTTPVFDHMPWRLTSWGSFSGPTYVRLKEGASPELVAEEMNALAIRVGPSNRFQDRINDGIKPQYEFHLTKAVDAHLKSDTRGGNGRGSIASLITAAVIAFLILAIAIINVANLGTMLAMKRVREVAIRKALGAEGRHLMMQILVESVALTFLSMLIGVAMAEASLPVFSELMNRELTSAQIYGPAMLVTLIGCTTLVGIICGLYPALVAVRFRPVDYLAGVKPKLGSRFRNALIIVQFAATIGLLATCLVVFMQAEYAKSKNAGFNSAQMLEIGGISRPIVLQREKAFREALARIGGVEAVAAAHGMPGHDYNNWNGLTLNNGVSKDMRRFSVSEELLPMLGVKVLAGRLFDKNRAADARTEPDKGASGAIILNDLAYRELGFASPEEAIGQEVRTWGDFRSTIIGVVENLRTRSARSEPSPTYYWIGPHEYRHVVVKVKREGMAETLATVDQVWREFFPDLPIGRQFVDDAFAEYYDNERRQGWLLLFSASVMVIIAVMGLYGLAALATERRSREIGIRKVLGARSHNIVRLLLWQFSTPVLVANLIAWPIAWWSLSEWLESFVDRISLSPFPFLVAGLGVLAVAWVTIIGHTLKVARANPIKALRYE